MKVDAQTLEIAALCFATAAHAGQVRKYTGAPYIEHPMAVPVMRWIGQRIMVVEDLMREVAA